jgi:hypothetical protein
MTMAYDYPYRLERTIRYSQNGYTLVDTYKVLRTGDGVICEGENFNEMRKLVDAANEAFMEDSGHRGR